MRRLLILVLVSVVTMITIIGCDSKSDDNNLVSDNTVQEANIDVEKFKEEEAEYSKLLTSGKTYEEMNASERTQFVTVADDLDSFTEEFREKYKDIIAEIEMTKQEAVAKWKAEKDEVKAEIVERENIIGTSNKDFTSLDKSKPSDVRNDTTGNWKLSRVATTEDILEYVKSYYKTNFSSDKEIHAIVNFTLNTTTQISKLFDNIVAVTIHEYVDKEEHDANKLFSGMVLGEYWIYLDNGDIEKID